MLRTVSLLTYSTTYSDNIGRTKLGKPLLKELEKDSREVWGEEQSKIKLRLFVFFFV